MALKLAGHAGSGAGARSYTEPRSARVCLFGASPDTGNLGVTALCWSVLSGVYSRLPSAAVTVFDYGKGSRSAEFAEMGERTPYTTCGAALTRRWHRPESLWRARVAARLGGAGSEIARAVREADVVLDLSGGDSFSDVYGARRFQAIAMPKLIALESGRPLVLLPQTYGPFKTARSRRVASRIVRGAELAWARDARSFEVLKELLGGAFDPSRHRLAVDVAFGLKGAAPSGLARGLQCWKPRLRLGEETPAAQGRARLHGSGHARIALNVSGLLWNDPSRGARFGFKADYRVVMHRLLSRLMDESEAGVLMVPHVFTRAGHFEHDPDACQGLAAMAPSKQRRRIGVLEECSDPRAAKWAIGLADWFCGARMHAGIAALSSGVPAAGVAYSRKFAGVFETCGQKGHVADLRKLDADEAVDALWRSWQARDEARERLGRMLPGVTRMVGEVFDEVAAVATGTEHRSRKADFDGTTATGLRSAA